MGCFTVFIAAAICLALLPNDAQCQDTMPVSNSDDAFLLLEQRLVECEGLVICDYNLEDIPPVHCINKNQLCDGVMDCPTSGMDEKYCDRCEDDEVLCQDTFTCAKPCDGIAQCGNAEDEKYCPTKCEHHEVLCSDQKTCAKVCNRIRECPNGDDEAGCPANCLSGEVLCQNKQQCAKPCDGIWTCENGEDEADCPFQCQCGPGDYICMVNERCIHGTGVCEPQNMDTQSCGTGNNDGDDEDVRELGTQCRPSA